VSVVSATARAGKSSYDSSARPRFRTQSQLAFPRSVPGAANGAFEGVPSCSSTSATRLRLLAVPDAPLASTPTAICLVCDVSGPAAPTELLLLSATVQAAAATEFEFPLRRLPRRHRRSRDARTTARCCSCHEVGRSANRRRDRFPGDRRPQSRCRSSSTPAHPGSTIATSRDSRRSAGR